MGCPNRPTVNDQFAKIRNLVALLAALVSGAAWRRNRLLRRQSSVVVVVRLWDGPAPKAPKTAVEESIDSHGRVKNVSVPMLAAHFPDKAVATGAAIIVCLGGGYSQLAAKKHGEGAAALLV